MHESTSSILLFGGTFDPPHHAHVRMPMLVADAVDAERVIFIPANLNPQKDDEPPTEAHHRLAMLEAAIAHDPRARISKIELDRPPPSYSIDTVKALREELGPDAPPFRLLIGADQALNFNSWRASRELEQLAEPLVMPRSPHTIERLPEAYEQAYPGKSALWMERTLPIPTENASSTHVRDAAAHGVQLGSIVPETVAAYIQEHGLYGFTANRDTIG